MHCHVGVSLLHDPPVLLLKHQKKKNVSTDPAFRKDVRVHVKLLTSTSAAPGSLLKHMVMVLRAILKKLVKDTDFPCNQNVMSNTGRGGDRGV